MEQDTISLLEVTELMKDVRANTNDFINGLKSSIFLEKNGELVNPEKVWMNFYRDGRYYLIIDGYVFNLNSNGVAAFVNKLNTTESEDLSQMILNRNSDVITNALKHLYSEKPKYYVGATDDKNYMGFECDIDDNHVKVSTTSVSISAKEYGESSAFNYTVKDGSITFAYRLGYAKREVSIDSISDVLGDKIDAESIYIKINEFLKNTQISTEKLPLVLKNQLESKISSMKL